MPDPSPRLPVAPVLTAPPSVAALSLMRRIVDAPPVSPSLAARIANRYGASVSRRATEFSPFFVRLRRARQQVSETGDSVTTGTSGYELPAPTSAAPVSRLTRLTAPRTVSPSPPTTVSRSVPADSATTSLPTMTFPAQAARLAASVTRVMGAEPPLSAAIAARTAVSRSASLPAAVYRVSEISAQPLLPLLPLPSAAGPVSAARSMPLTSNPPSVSTSLSVARVPFVPVLSAGTAVNAVPASAAARTVERSGVPDLPAPGRPAVPQALWRQAAPPAPAPVERTAAVTVSRDTSLLAGIESHAPAPVSRTDAPLYRTPAALPRPAFVATPAVPGRSRNTPTSETAPDIRETVAPAPPLLSRTRIFSPVFTPLPSLVRRTAAVPALAFLSAAVAPYPTQAQVPAQVARRADVSPPMALTRMFPVFGERAAARSVLPAPFVPTFFAPLGLSRRPDSASLESRTGEAYRSSADRFSAPSSVSVFSAPGPGQTVAARQAVAPPLQTSQIRRFPSVNSALPLSRSRQTVLPVAATSGLPSTVSRKSSPPPTFVTTISRLPFPDRERGDGSPADGSAAAEPFAIARQIALPPFANTNLSPPRADRAPMPVSVPLRSAILSAAREPVLRRQTAAVPPASASFIAAPTMTILSPLLTQRPVDRLSADGDVSRAGGAAITARRPPPAPVSVVPRQTTPTVASLATGIGANGVNVARRAAVPPSFAAPAIRAGETVALRGAHDRTAIGQTGMPVNVRPVFRSPDTAVANSGVNRAPGISAPIVFPVRGAAAEIGQVLRTGTLTTESLVSRRGETLPATVQRDAESAPAPAGSGAPDTAGAGKEAGTGDLLSLDRQVDALWDRFMQRFRIEQERSGYH